MLVKSKALFLQVLCAPHELGNWNDGDSEEGWEAELHLDEGNLVADSRVAIKEKRKKDREFRRKAQDLQRTQQKTMINKCAPPSLGSKTKL